MTTITFTGRSQAQNSNLEDGEVMNYKKTGSSEGIKQKNIERCIQLLEHTERCRYPTACMEGDSCFRMKQVLGHHRNCRKREDCSICEQLIGLCQIHSQRCQSHPFRCHVPHCRNEKPSQFPSEGPIGAQESSMEPTNEEFRHVMGKLMKAFRMPSLAEKRSIIHQLFISNPQATTKLLRELYKAKLSNVATNQRKPPKRMIRQPPCSHSAHLLAMEKQNNALNGKNITGSPPIPWNAKVSFVPIQ